MTRKLTGKKVAIVATDGFEQSELVEPKQALEDAGAEIFVIAPHDGSIRGWNMTDWGEKVDVDVVVAEADAKTYDALLLPGGVMSPDHLRANDGVVQFVKTFFGSDRPVAAICHGPWTLIDAGVVRGRRMTSWPSLRTDLSNAGAEWVDEETVIDDKLLTSRKPADIPAFTAHFIEMIASSGPPVGD